MLLTALLLGIVEGATEFLPISSTGHLILAGWLVGFQGNKAATFEIFIQLGAILAVMWVYRHKLWKLCANRSETHFAGRRGLYLLAITTVPALIFGFLLHGVIKRYLFNPLTVAIGLLVGGIAMLLIERKANEESKLGLDDLTRKEALSIGLAQVLALFPGVSRSGATIMGGLAVGINRETAVEYSFLAAVPIMLAATGYDLLKALPSLSGSDVPFFAVGLISTFVSALIVVRWLLKYVRQHNFVPFAWYRIGLALLIFTSLALR